MAEVLMVCTANLCRSPLAEHLLRRRFAAAGIAWTVSSAGTDATGGRPMHPMARQALAERGIEAGAWTSRPLTKSLVASSDLVLTATRAHLERILQMSPGAVRRAFVLRQFSYFLSAPAVQLSGTGPAELISSALQGRSELPAEPVHSYDLKDPINGRAGAFAACADTIDASLALVMAALKPDRPPVRGGRHAVRSAAADR